MTPAVADGMPAREALHRGTRGAKGQPDAPPIRIVHLGLGAFHRAHQAWYTHIANGACTEPWGIAAFTGRGPQAALLLQPQDGLYTLITRGAETDTAEIVGSLSEAVDGRDQARWCELFSNSGTAIITLTITEAGYHYDKATGLDRRDEGVAADIACLRGSRSPAPTTAPGRLVHGLRARRDAGLGGLAIVSCDNLSNNGDVTRCVVTQLARAVDPALAEWIEANVSFVSTVVDRITPATTAADVEVAAELIGFQDRSPVVTEPFTEWIISGEFPAGRPPWERAGARFVVDVAPFEQRKLWLLNSGHSLLAYVGLLRGHTTVAEAMEDELCVVLLERLWEDAAAVLPFPAEEIHLATSALRRRFRNPRIRHRLTQIARDGSQKLPLRAVPVIQRRLGLGLDAGQGEVTLIAAWLLHLGSSTSRVDDVGAGELIGALDQDLEHAAGQVVRLLSPGLANPAALIGPVAERAVWLSRMAEPPRAISKGTP